MTYLRSVSRIFPDPDTLTEILIVLALAAAIYFVSTSETPERLAERPSAKASAPATFSR